MSGGESLFPGRRVIGDKNLAYAALHPFPLPGWEPPELIRLRGKTWQIIFKPDGADYVAIERQRKIVVRHLEGPNVLIGGTEGVSDAAEAVRTQKPLIDMIRGLILLGGPPGAPLLLPPVWEGVLKKSSKDTITYEASRTEATALGIRADELRKWGARRQALDLSSAPAEVGFALRWYYKGVSDLHNLAGERLDAFIELWLCIITLVNSWHAQTVGGDPSQLEKFIAYAGQRLGLSGPDFQSAKDQFVLVRDRRNSVLKGGGGMMVVEEEATAVAQLAHLLLAHEVDDQLRLT